MSSQRITTCKIKSILTVGLLLMTCSSQVQDLSSFIDTSMGLASIAASAYIGILQFFNNKVCDSSSVD